MATPSPSPDAENAAPVQQLQGEVTKSVYESEDAGFAVLRLCDAQGVEHCVVGEILAGVSPGQHLSLAGKWVMHKEFGRQFAAETCTVAQPSTPEGLIRYLSSGIIKGVGETYARRIVETFGDETLFVLENAGRRLKEVPGLGKKRMEQIRTSWKANRELRDLRIALESMGISQSYFKRIHDAYGDAAPNVIRENPYRMADEIRGIGFLYADRIAEKLGLEKTSMQRRIAGIRHAFSQIKNAGHVCMPEPEFTVLLAQLLDVENAQAEESIRLAVRNGLVCTDIDPSNGTSMLYDPQFHRCENELPFLLKRMLRQRDFPGQKIARIEPLPETKLSSGQLDAVAALGHAPITVITGGPGVGKTTVVSEIVRRARAAKQPLVLAAPTGRAAKRMNETTREDAFTIHRLLKWDPVRGTFVHNRKNPLAWRLYVIDEASMLDLPLATALFRAIPENASVVVVGDPDQLPSVGPGNVLNDLIDSGICPVSRLTTIFRQGEGSGIIRAAHAVNAGRMPEQIRADLPDFFIIEKDTEEEAADVMERLVADRIPARFGLDPVRDIQVLTPMNRGAAGTAAMNDLLRDRLNPSGRELTAAGRIFRLGDKVIQVLNNYDAGVFNGDMGVVREIDPDGAAFTVQFDAARRVTYPAEDATQLAPAYAITVHKAQGSEFPAVVMPLLPSHYMMLQRNLLYTGITRAKKLMVLVASRKALRIAVTNAVRDPRYSLLRAKLTGEFA